LVADVYSKKRKGQIQPQLQHNYNSFVIYMISTSCQLIIKKYYLIFEIMKKER